LQGLTPLYEIIPVQELSDPCINSNNCFT